jgi:glycosyltransferase involved in cell wall biosynthesis
MTEMLENPHQDNGPSDIHNIRKLRILHVVPTYYPAVRYGGPVRSVHSLAIALVELGHEVHVFTSSMDGSIDLDVPEKTPVNVDGVFVRYFRVPLLRRLCWSPSMGTALREEISRFDIVHLHSVFLWPTSAAARFAKAAGVPYIVTPRGMLGHAVIRGKSRFVKSAWIHIVEHKTLRDAAAVHVTSELEGTEIQSLGLGLPQVCCVPNGVASPLQYPTLDQGPFAGLSRPYVLFLSRISWKKGLDRLIKSWKWVPNLTLIVAGNDDEGYRRQLTVIAGKEGVSDRVRFIGQVSDEHKWALYENALLFVLPSYSENFGNVVAEAMAMGCPVVITKEVGLAALVLETRCGVVVDGEPTHQAQAINELSADDAKRRRLGIAGQNAARKYLSWGAAGKRIDELYRLVISAQL